MYHSAIKNLMPDARRQLASRLRAMRLARFLTQHDLSERSGLGRATIARIEAGVTAPRMRTVRALAQALDVAPGELVPDPESLWREGL
ncbi:helix-turn-helix domain-containing protein [Micromonospora siamensis]|uniref:helix-turn-helix domain-containing protein n=1 Tax=Micromonospora siamensis TaxID=299152 RepID=UPI000B5AFCF7